MSDLYKELDYAVQSDLYASGKFIKMYNALEQENKQLKSILTELEEWLNSKYEKGKELLCDDIRMKTVLDKIQELKEKYK